MGTARAKTLRLMEGASAPLELKQGECVGMCGLGGGPGCGRGRLLPEEVGFIVAAMVSRVQISLESITFAVVWGAVIETRQVMSWTRIR